MIKKTCTICGHKLLRKNKTGFCILHMNKSGKSNPFYGKHHTEDTISKIKTTTSTKSKELWKDATYRDKVIRGVSKPRRESFKKEQSERIKQWYIDNPKQREIRRGTMRDSWKKGLIIKNGFSCNKSKIETEFFNKIKELRPDVERKTLRIGKDWLFPDVIFQRDGIIIEFFGNFWHANPEMYKENTLVRNQILAKEIWDVDKTRIKKLENAGYQVYIVWEKDYKENPKAILKKFDEILNWESCSC